jgi:hypothetical protein
MMALHVPEYIANYGKPAVAARQDIAMMKAAGINTIGLALGNKHLPQSRFAAMIHAYYQAAMDDGGMKIVPDVWGDVTQPDSLAAELGLISQKYEPVWLRRKGRLVISLWLDSGSHPLPDYGETARRLCQQIGGREQVLLFHHPQIVEGVQLPAGRKAMEGFPVSHGKRFGDVMDRRTPPADYLGVVAMLKSPARIAVMLGETVIAQRELPAGVTSWLVYQPRRLNDPRKLYACDPENAYPKAEPDFLVTSLAKPFWDAEVYLAVYRGNDRVGFFRSHRPIVSVAARGELTTIGDAFKLKE